MIHKLPLHVGNTKNVVLVLHLDAEGLEFLCTALPQRDAFTRELWEAKRHVERIQEARE